MKIKEDPKETDHVMLFPTMFATMFYTLIHYLKQKENKTNPNGSHHATLFSTHMHPPHNYSWVGS